MSKTKAPSSKRKVTKNTRVNREKAKHTRHRQEDARMRNIRWGRKTPKNDSSDSFGELIRRLVNGN